MRITHLIQSWTTLIGETGTRSSATEEAKGRSEINMLDRDQIKAYQSENRQYNTVTGFVLNMQNILNKLCLATT